MFWEKIGTVLLIASETSSQMIRSSSVFGKGKVGIANIPLARKTLVKEPDKYGAIAVVCEHTKRE